MTVRTITGNIYYARSGTKIVGKVHEKFTLIDGIRVATGSYRYVSHLPMLINLNFLGGACYVKAEASPPSHRPTPGFMARHSEMCASVSE